MQQLKDIAVRHHLAVVALQVVTVLVALGSALFQVALLAWSWARDLQDSVTSQRAQLVIAIFLGLVAVEVVCWCVWRLSRMARSEGGLREQAFRYVDLVITAIGIGAGVALWACIALIPGKSASVYLVVLVGGAAVALAGIALVALVLRRFLAQSIARSIAAAEMRAELDTVI